MDKKNNKKQEHCNQHNMIRSVLRNEEQQHELTIVHDRAVRPAHSVTFAALERQKHRASPTRRGLNRTLTPPACRWRESQSASMNKASETPESPVPSIQNMSLHQLSKTSQLRIRTIAPERIVDAGPRLPQRLPTGSVLSPKKSKRDRKFVSPQKNSDGKS